MNILVRADSSLNIGTGHIMRDLVLAKKYSNSNITFATQNLQGNINHKILEAGYKLKILRSNDFQELDKIIKELNIDLLIIDHYGIDYEFEKQLKIQNPKLRILSLDDTYERHYCDILLNHNIYADKKKYKDLVPPQCAIKCGKKYTLIRDEFIKEKKRKYKKNKKTTIFLAMGGADHSNLNIKILKVLKKFKNIKVNLVTTTANKNLVDLEKYCKSKKWIKLHINSNHIASLMKQCDFGIITPSVSANEMYFLGKKFISIKTADNQKEMCRYLKSKKFFVLIAFNKNKLFNRVSRLREYIW